MPANVFQLLALLVQLYSYVLLARIILSWIPSLDRSHAPVDLLYRVTEPVLAPVRSALPDLGPIDISPIIVFIVLRILQGFLLNLAQSF